MEYFQSMESFLGLLKLLGEGALVSLEVFFLTLIFSLPLGLLVTFGRMAKNKIVSGLVSFYILLMRGTPLILQLVFIYFIIPNAFHINIDRFWAAILACTINYAAYFAEIYRGGIQSMPRGQYEAAQVLGFSKSQTFLHIILPQVLKRVLLPISNEVITLVKDTALVQTIGVGEMFRAAKNETNRSFSTLPLFVAGVFYLVMNAVVTKVFSWLEKKLDYYQ